MTAYDFNPAQANAFNVHLIGDAAAFAAMTEEQAEAALQVWTTIYGQIASPSVSFAVETNLALQANGSMTLINLDDGQAEQIVALAKAMVDYLQSGAALPNVTLSFSVSDSGTLPPAFEISMLFRIQRDAETATSSIVSTVDRSLPGDFASAFVKAFPRLALAVGPNGVNSFWAVQRTLLDVTIGGTNNGPFFSSPMPLDTMLQSGMVNLPPLPESLIDNGTTQPSQLLFSDIDLDRLNASFFQAVDDITDIDVADARETLANLYATHQIDWLFANDADARRAGDGVQNQHDRAIQRFVERPAAGHRRFLFAPRHGRNLDSRGLHHLLAGRADQQRRIDIDIPLRGR